MGSTAFTHLKGEPGLFYPTPLIFTVFVLKSCCICFAVNENSKLPSSLKRICVPIPQYIHIIYRMHQMLVDIHQQDLWKSNKDETKDLILYFFHKIKTSFRFQSLNPKANRIDDSLSEYHARNNVARLFQEKLNYVHLKRLEPSIDCTINYIYVKWSVIEIVAINKSVIIFFRLKTCSVFVFLELGHY